jgi:hypothetical protein
MLADLSGVLNNPTSMKYKIAVCLLGFDNGVRIERAIERFYTETHLPAEIEIDFYLFALGYPIPTPETNFIELEMLASRHNINLCVMNNAGQDGNIIQVHKMLESESLDAIIFYDADTKPNKPTWLTDALDVMAHDDKCGFVTINCSITDNALCQQTEHRDVSGVKCARLKWPGGWPMLMFSRHFPWQHFGKTFSYYGGTEGNILDALTANKMHGYMMRDHDDSRDTEDMDPEYIAWKKYAIVRPDAKSLADWMKDQHTA